MRTGYLCLQTHTESPGLVRVLALDRLPDMNRPVSEHEIRYAARFNDVDAAQMHVQNSLHSRLIDLNNRIYRVGLVEAMAVVESDILRHQRVWIDPSLSAADTERMEQLTERHRQRQQRADRIWQNLGSIAAAILVMLLLGTF